MLRIPVLSMVLLALPATGYAAGLDGATVLITNTFQGAQTENVEKDVSAFGMTNNVFASVGAGMEFPEFITLYDVDVAADRISFRWITSEMADRLSGPTPDGNHDRNYFVFDLPEGLAITDVVFDRAGSALLEGSADPTAEVISPNKIVMDFAAGVVRGVGFNPSFIVSTSTSQK
ncbi:MAG: hypothetical protein AAF982_04275 [Pseudomonadota bacterium]